MCQRKVLGTLKGPKLVEENGGGIVTDSSRLLLEKGWTRLKRPLVERG